jgi:fasciclin domain-containing protein
MGRAGQAGHPGVRPERMGCLPGGTYSINGAHVVCGNVQTANATVYIIDPVLMPKS